jgi:hypothetical protein
VSPERCSKVLFAKHADVVETEIPEVGTLRNTVRLTDRTDS